ncbi:MAG: hypothetical protein WCS37_02535 [Chloroflexota bacterium]|nr:hypothetical protein [Chloroflexota bacterium]
MEQTEQKRYDEIKAKLFEMTPSLVEDVLAIFRQDQDLVTRFGNDLPRITEQEVSRLRDILLGAIMLNYPQLLGREVKWLLTVATARNFNLETVRSHLRHYRVRLSKDLAPEQSALVLNLFDQALDAEILQPNSIL